MFVGHFGVAFAAKRATPRTNLALLILAGELIDVIWPIFVLLGIERVRIEPGLTPVTPLNFVHYPWTHSLLMCAVWGIVLAAIYYGFKKDKRTALILGALVVSHWILDYLTHIPDLPLMPGTTAKYGLALWHSRLWTAIIELAIFFGGVILYIGSTHARDRVGSIGLAVYIGFLTVIYFLNLQGAPPPSVTIMAASALAGTALLLLWAWWIDRHREPTV